MEKMMVSELMRPIYEFPSISSQVTLFEAVEALEKADQEFKSGKAPERILIAYNESGKILGKLSPIDVVKGLEPNYTRIDIPTSIPYYRTVKASFELMKKEYRLWYNPLSELWKKAYSVKIHEFIKLPTPDHIVNADDKMSAAFHLFVLFRHGSLFVQDGHDIVGLIRFSDVYEKIRETMRACSLPS